MKNLNITEALNKHDIKTVSEFIQFVYDILNPEKNDIYNKSDFVFDMSDYGSICDLEDELKCIGCMATATIILLGDVEPVQYVDYKNADMNYEVINYFESCVNAVRINDFFSIVNYLRELLRWDIWPNFDESTLRNVKNNTYYLAEKLNHIYPIHDVDDLIKIYNTEYIKEIVETVHMVEYCSYPQDLNND